MIVLTGDTRREFDWIFEFCAEHNTTWDDVLVILGDAGVNCCLDESDEALKRELSRLNDIQSRMSCAGWFCGHYHIDDQMGPVRIVHHDFLELNTEVSYDYCGLCGHGQEYVCPAGGGGGGPAHYALQLDSAAHG